MILQDKIVLITGASSGIGQATAIRFAEAGAKVIINYRTNHSGAEQTLAKVKALTDGYIVQADVSRSEEVKKLFEAAIDRYSTIDILVNNAAIVDREVPFMEASYDDMKVIIDADLSSVLMCSQAAARIMKKNKHGKILNTSSIRGWEFGGRAPVYSAAKAAVNSFTRTFAKEMAPEIQVNAVAPGFVKTRVQDATPPGVRIPYIEQTRLKRWITPEEVADTFLFLAQNDAITGQVIYIEAGYMLR